MSDNEDLLGDDLGDQSLADYNLGNEEEEQLLADDYENGGPQNVPSSIREHYGEVVEMIPPSYANHGMQYAPPPLQYQPMAEECVVPNITVEVPNIPPHPVYVPEPRHFEAEHAVPPAIPAGPIEPPQIVPSELTVAVPNNEGGRERFISERPVGAQRMPQIRDIPDTLDAVVVPRYGRGRTTWRASHYRHQHPYRRNNMHRGNFNQRHSFPPPQQIIRPNIPQQIIRQEIRPEMIRQEIRPEMIRQEIRPEMIRPEIRPDIRPEIRPEIIRTDMIRPARPEMIPPEILPELPPPEMMRPMIRPELRPELIRPEMPMGPEISPERPMLPEMSFRPNMERPPFPQFQRFQFRPEERPMFMRPNFERPMYPFPRQFNPRFGPPMREIVGNPHMPRVTIRQVPDKMAGKEPEVRMLPVPLPPHIPPGGLAGKKVLINPHFKGNFQPVDGLPAYIPTRIHKSPPPSPATTLGPVKDIDEAAERFIAEQRTALARSAARKFPPRRSPQRYIENTTIEIENELAARPRRRSEDELLRRQEEFINENRAGLRRRMRSPSPAGRRSPSPGPAMRRPRPDTDRRDRHDEQDEYSRRLREQQSLREHVVRAKEVRRRRNAANLHKQLERDQEPQKATEPSKDKSPPRKDNIPPTKATSPPKEPPTSTEETKPDTTRNTPEKSPQKERKDSEKEREKEKVKEKSPVKAKDDEVNSTCEGLTPPWRGSEDDDLDMILGDIDGILSDEDDSGRFKHKPDKPEPPASKPVTDLRSKLPPKHEKPPRQKIVFLDQQRNKKDKTPPRRAVVSSTKADEDADKLFAKTKQKAELLSNRSRQRITFDKKEAEKPKEKETKQEKTPPFSNRRVILQRKVSKDKPVLSRMEDRTQASAGIFSRAVRTAIGDSIVRRDEPQIEYESDSDLDEDTLLNEEVGNIAAVENLPHGMTDSRLRALAGNDVQNLVLDKEERSAKITFKTTLAAETFKKKFNNKMVAASRLSVALR